MVFSTYAQGQKKQERNAGAKRPERHGQIRLFCVVACLGAQDIAV